MRTLYVSDLDGTLLRSDETTSSYTNDVINFLTRRGMLFSYATARSLITAKKVTGGICAHIPLIVYNGAFIFDNATEEILAARYFDATAIDLLDDLHSAGVYPIVYAYIDGKEKFSFIPHACTPGMTTFLNSRKGDIRTHAVANFDDLKRGDIFYITCIDEPQKLEPLYEKYRNSYHCVYQRDVYSHEQWLEFMPKKTSKSHAILHLKELLGCDRLVVFGDGKNDLDMFDIADECYAVENAVDELKERATAVIGSNDKDDVARWLEARFEAGEQEL